MGFLLENKDTAKEFRLFFKRGIWSELLKMPTPKPRAFNDWPDEHGKDYDTISPTVFEPLTYNIDCYMTSTSLSRLQEQRDVLLDILKNPSGFNLRADELGRSFALRYVSSNGLRIFNPLRTNGIVYTEFSLTLENTFAPVGVDFYLADVNGLILSYPDKPILFEQQKQLF
ncbi:MAG TPA: hypothetical protein DEF78_06310 [Sphingobacterium sp.]|nr:hypothetical protein [Sphingobacterium sp.]